MSSTAERAAVAKSVDEGDLAVCDGAGSRHGGGAGRTTPGGVS